MEIKFFKSLYYKLPFSLINFFHKILSKFHNSVINDFIFSPYGEEYNLTKKDRINILQSFLKILTEVESGCSLESLITLAKHLLNLKKKSTHDEERYIVECGCFKGASTSALSIICDLIGRKIIVYDSFKGLPKTDVEVKTFYTHLNNYGTYKEGMFRSSLVEFKSNIIKYGKHSSCIIREGYFEEILKLHSEKLDFIFLDVDLISSTKSCIKHLWPYLNNDCKIFTDDSCDLEVVKIWFDNNWWTQELNQLAPGYIGSGCGLPLGAKFSSLGYSIKNQNYSNFSQASWFVNK